MSVRTVAAMSFSALNSVQTHSHSHQKHEQRALKQRMESSAFMGSLMR